MQSIWRRLVIELIVMAVFVAIVWFLWPILQERMGAAFVDGAEKAHKKRLFGDAWKDV